MAEAELHKVIKHLRNVLVMQDAARMTDGDLLQRYLQRRDEAAFEALVRRHGPMVLAVCRRVLRNLHDAEDAFQATFLVLVRKASALRSPSMVGNWLYGVAFRTARDARRAALKRRAKEAKAMPRAGASEDSWSDLRDVLDQELERLPDKYRSVVVLCDLEGASGKEAARHLALPEGTVASRLARGRAMLAKRLARHALVLSGGSLTAMLSHDAASACVPTSLLVSTVKAATLFAGGQAATAALISVEVAALTEGVLTAMFLSKVKVAMTILLVAVVLVTGTGVMMSQGSTPDTQEKKSQASAPVIQERNDTPPAQSPKEGDRRTVKDNDLWLVYNKNEALADEEYLGKRVIMAAKMQRITGLGRRLVTVREQNKVYSANKLIYALESGRMRFEFTEDDRKQLAKLKEGQELTIEGKVKGYLHSEDDKRGAGCIVVEDCKIIGIAKELPSPGLRR